MNFPDYRPRRMRKNENLRRLIRETRLAADNLIYPLFVVPGKGAKKPIVSMPGVFQMSADVLVQEVRAAREAGLPAVLLFGVPERKDECSGPARDGASPAVRRIKDKKTDILAVTDVCLCEI